MKLLKMASEKELKYIELTNSIEHLIDKNCSWVANYANVCAAIQAKFNFWWCGFYMINQNKKLELGPDQAMTYAGKANASFKVTKPFEFLGTKP